VTAADFTTRTFWVNTLERVIRTGAQTALALGVTDATTNLHVNWQQAGITTGLAMLAALLTALAGKTVGDSQSPSFLLGAAPKPATVPVKSAGPVPAANPADHDGPPW
jgi:hypothetical protein